MRFIAFDLETTGILPGVDKIVEIGAVRFIDGKAEGIFSTLVDPERPIPSAATNINKITDEMVFGKPKIMDLLPAFAEFCGTDPLVAHNASFDAEFVTRDVIRHEAPAPRGCVMDTFALAKRIYPGLPNYKLATLVQHLNIPSAEFHRAEQDAYYCGYVFINMLQKLGWPQKIVTIAELVIVGKRSEYRFPQIIPQPKQLELI
jgi:DNA polymerase-3 subunit epsilon